MANDLQQAPDRSGEYPRVPLVSICMPHLNSQPFTAERFATIAAQSFQDWELVIVDSASSDGSREFWERAAQADGRVHMLQGPRDGIYTNLNRGLDQCRGKYVYFAISDDTMAGDCLEKLVAALESRPECDLAHCSLRMIDEQGRSLADWWSSVSTFARSSGPLAMRPHVRQAPLDGVLHLLGRSVYVSLTQLLIRRSLITRVGTFESRWGSVGDFNWQMRAALVAHTVHVPETWGGWRVHSQQATASAELDSPAHAAKAEEMMVHALAVSWDRLAPAVRRNLRSRWEPRMRDWRHFTRGLRQRSGIWGRRLFIARRLLSGSWAARRHLAMRMPGFARLRIPEPLMIRRWVEGTCRDSLVLPLHGAAADVAISPPRT